MNRYLEATWFRTTLLLSALAAGGVVTLIVPSYEQIAAMREAARPAAAAHDGGSGPSSGVTGIDVDQRHLKTVRSLG